MFIQFAYTTNNKRTWMKKLSIYDLGGYYKVKYIFSILFFMLLAINSAEAKPKLEGFVLRGDADGAPGYRSHFDNPNGSEWAEHVDGIVVTVEWADLQKSMDGDIEDNNTIDKALKAIRTYNRKKAKNKKLFIKLRVFAGIYSPLWVGEDPNVGSLDVDYKNSKQGTLPKFWTSAFQNHWKKFQKKLAERYDKKALILDVALSGCMTHNAETMWRNYGSNNGTTIEDLKYAGLKQSKDEQCLLNQLTIAAYAWKKTNISMALNSWKEYDKPKNSKGSYPTNPKFIQKMVNKCKKKLGKRCIVGNNSVGLASISKDEARNSDKALYYVNHYANSTYIQTTTVADNIHKAIDYARVYAHASMAELPKLKALDKYDSEYLGSTSMQNIRTALKKKNKGKANKIESNVKTMFRVNNTMAYAFSNNDQYSRYSLTRDSGDYINPIEGYWPNKISDNMEKISASFLAPNNTVYIFLENGNYYRYYYNQNDRTDGPFSTSSAWRGISKKDAKKIVAVLPWKGNRYICFFLNTGEFIIYDWKYHYALYKIPISAGYWPGVSPYAEEIIAAMKWDDNVGYIFLTDNRYLRYDFNTYKARSPRSTKALWPKLLSAD